MEIVMPAVVQDPVSSHGLYIMPQKLVLSSKLTYALKIRLKIM